MDRFTLRLSPEVEVFFLSDLHLNHQKHLEFDKSRQGFTDIDLFNEAIIDSINQTVREEDHLFLLGDIIFGNIPMSISEFFTRINCKNIYLIIGNHDKRGRMLEVKRLKLISNLLYLRVFYGQELTMFFLCHYPMIDWYKKHYGSFHIHGHTHRNLLESDPELYEKNRIFDASGILKPISLKEIIKNYV